MYWYCLLLEQNTSGYAGTTFLATITYGEHTPADPLVFPIPLQNSGGHYDRTTGIYTAPVDGTYEFIIHILSYNDFDCIAYLVAGSLEAAYSLNWGAREIRGKGGGETLALL